MRTVKTALAVTASVYLARLLNLESPFFAAIAALITMQGNLIDSFSMGRDRIVGTLLGAVIGFAAAQVAHGNPLVLGLGVAVIIYICNRLHWNRAIAIAAIVFASIMLGGQVLTLIQSLNRVVDTFVGIVVAVVVNFTISRPRSRDRVIKSATDLIIKSREIIRMLICQGQRVSLATVDQELEVLERELPALKKEVQMHIARAEENLNFDEIKALLEELYHNISLLAEMKCGRLNSHNASLISQIYGLDITPEQQLDDRDIVFNYHLKTALELTEKLARVFALKPLAPHKEELAPWTTNT